MTEARLLFTMYVLERSTPSVELVLLETTNLTVAPLATAPDHSTSKSASVSSPALMMPGSVPFNTIVGLFTGSPK